MILGVIAIGFGSLNILKKMNQSHSDKYIGGFRMIAGGLGAVALGVILYLSK